MRMSYKSIEITDCHQILLRTDSSFFFVLQKTLLLGLKEAGWLNEMQHRQAEATLLEQHREYIREYAESLKYD